MQTALVIGLVILSVIYLIKQGRHSFKKETRSGCSMCSADKDHASQDSSL